MLIRAHHVFGERREEKREKKARVARDQVLVGFDPTHFWSCLSWIPRWDVRSMSLDEEILIIVGENW